MPCCNAFWKSFFEVDGTEQAAGNWSESLGDGFVIEIVKFIDPVN